MQAGPETWEWVTKYYDAIDANDIDMAIEYFTPDARIRFGNGEFVVGRDAIHADLRAKSHQFQAIKHHFDNIWETGDGGLVLDATTEFSTLDGRKVLVYGAGLYRYRGKQWTEQRHYGDASAVFGAG